MAKMVEVTNPFKTGTDSKELINADNINNIVEALKNDGKDKGVSSVIIMNNNAKHYVAETRIQLQAIINK